MKANRTFGIEIECLSNTSREELANLLNEAFRREFGGVHRAITESYQHNTNSNNFAILGAVYRPENEQHRTKYNLSQKKKVSLEE